MNLRGWIGSVVLVAGVIGVGGILASWKNASQQAAAAASARQPEPMESVTVAVAQNREHREATTSIGTVLALQSITLRNELAGTARQISLVPGAIVEEGTLLVQLDIAVEQAELRAQEAQASLAQASESRMERAIKNKAASELELDRARAERDVALAQVERTRAVIARKTIRAPFRARVGMADVHPGQYLNEGTPLTTLQGVDDAANVDFTVAQGIAAQLHPGDAVEVIAVGRPAPIIARIVAIDSRVDPLTRNALVRARIDGLAPAPGASVRVRVPVGPSRTAVSIPVSALRKGPAGDHVFVITSDKDGKSRAAARKVEVGPVLGDEILILSGLSPDEKVAASGSFKLRESVLVAIASGPQSAHGAR
jgi:membrane fusion protein (multidrug efflux system)